VPSRPTWTKQGAALNFKGKTREGQVETAQISFNLNTDSSNAGPEPHWDKKA
jgi:hypothetical protein